MLMTGYLIGALAGGVLAKGVLGLWSGVVVGSWLGGLVGMTAAGLGVSPESSERPERPRRRRVSWQPRSAQGPSEVRRTAAM